MRVFALALVACLSFGPLLAATAPADPLVPSRRHLLGDVAERCGLPRNAIAISRNGEVWILSRRGLRPEQAQCALAELRNRGPLTNPPAGDR